MTIRRPILSISLALSLSLAACSTTDPSVPGPTDAPSEHAVVDGDGDETPGFFSGFVCDAVIPAQATIVAGLTQVQNDQFNGKIACSSADSGTYLLDTSIAPDPAEWDLWSGDASLEDAGSFGGEPGRINDLGTLLAVRSPAGWTIVLTESTESADPDRLLRIAEVTLTAIEPWGSGSDAAQ